MHGPARKPGSSSSVTFQPFTLARAFTRGTVKIGDDKLKLDNAFNFVVSPAQRLPVLQVNALFRRVTENSEWGQALLIVAGSAGLAPGATTDPLTAKSDRGYTGSDQSRQEMLQNSHFVDAKVQLFAKYGSAQWVRIGEYPIARELITK